MLRAFLNPWVCLVFAFLSTLAIFFLSVEMAVLAIALLICAVAGCTALAALIDSQE